LGRPRRALRLQPVDHLSPPPEPEDVPFDEAFEHLPPQVFALWIRLHAEPQAELNRGRKHVAERCKVPSRTFDRQLRELRRAGYVSVTAQTAPGVSAIYLTRRAAVIGASHFVWLSQTLSPELVADPAWDHGFPASGRTAADVSAARRAAAVPLRERRIRSRRRRVAMAASMTENEGDRRKATRGETSGEPQRAKSDTPPSVDRADRGKPEPVPSLSERMQKWTERQAKQRTELASEDESGSSQPLRGTQKKKVKQVSEERPVRSSSPDVRLRNAEALFSGDRAEELRAVLVDESQTRTARSAQRKARTKAGDAFLEIYGVLRREMYQADYRRPRHEPKAIQAAEGCLLAGVTPRDLIVYWSERVADFTRMEFPSIAFLASSNMIDEAKLATGPRRRRGPSSRTRGGGRGRIDVDEHHAFTPDKLHPDLEAHLASAGLVRVGELRVNKLLAIQARARATLSDMMDPPTDPLEVAAVEFFRGRER
jgi:hypothetical protein